jgi:hypothetical protein
MYGQRIIFLARQVRISCALVLTQPLCTSVTVQHTSQLQYLVMVL